jgi:DNA-nicking Smr family endonuclease
MKNRGKSQSSSSIPSLDLHGFKVEQVYDAIDRFLRQAEAGGAVKVRIITGIGTGKVKEKALAYLREANYSAKADVMGNGQTNDGSFIVYL